MVSLLKSAGAIVLILLLFAALVYAQTVLSVKQGGTGVTTAQGNGSKVQLSTGSTTTNDCVKFDANGNTADAGAACSSGAGIPPIIGSGNKRWEAIWRSGSSTEEPLNGVDNANTPVWTAATTSLPAFIVNFSGGFVEGQPQFLTGKNIDWRELGWVQSTTSNISVTAGVADTNTNSGNGVASPAGKYALFRYIHGTDTNWQCMTSDGTTQTLTDSGTAVDTAIHTWEIIFNDGTPNVVFQIDGVTKCTLTTHLPGNGVVVRRGWYVGLGGSGSTAFAEEAFYVQSDPTWP